MKDAKEISASVVGRLPRYYRFLCELSHNGIERISSRELAIRMGLTASQIRQDFNCYGGFGQQGYGYNVNQLKMEMAGILGIDTLSDAILIGAGNLGSAIANQMTFEKMGFRLTAVFDANPGLTGTVVRNLPIRSDREMNDYCISHKPAMAILCLPADRAPEVVEQLILHGVNSFWNFSHYDIHRYYPLANVENVHLSDSLMKLSYTIKNSKN